MNSWFTRVPWWIKVPAKLTLSHLPIPYRVWKRLALFDHGAMDNAAYAFSVFQRHHELARPAPGFTCLELGPGDSVATAIIAHSFGASAVWLVDSGDYASHDLEVYRSVVRYVGQKQQPVDLDFSQFHEMLACCSATYLTGGVDSLRTVPSGSIDFVFSQAVLEHIRLREFDALLSELRRILRPRGVMTHQIDLKDHMSRSLHSLRFPDRIWESQAMARAGLYTNRIRCGEILERFARAGLAVSSVERQLWDRLPVARHELARRFRQLATDDLLVHDMLVAAHPSETEGSGGIRAPS